MLLWLEVVKISFAFCGTERKNRNRKIWGRQVLSFDKGPLDFLFAFCVNEIEIAYRVRGY